jgi:hypothetical protein
MHRDFDQHLAHEKRQLLPLVLTTGDVPSFAGLSELRSVAYQTTTKIPFHIDSSRNVGGRAAFDDVQQLVG